MSDLFRQWGILQSPGFYGALGLFALMAVLSVPLLFRALRPRRGTMEWMQRVDQETYPALVEQPLDWREPVWILLSMLGAALMRLIYTVVALRIYLSPAPAETFLASLTYLLNNSVMAAALAVGVYLLLRCLWGQRWAALCAAILSGMLLTHYCDSLLLLCLSFLCLYFWMEADYEAPLFFNAFWMFLSGLFFAVAMLTCLALAWLCPFYIGVYVLTQILRYRNGHPEIRKNKLTVSVLLFSLCIVLGVLLLWLMYFLLSGKAEGSLLYTLDLKAIFGEFWPNFKEKLSDLLRTDPSGHISIYQGDLFLLLAGATSLPAVFHGAFRLKNMFCTLALCLLPAFLIMWLVNGIYLLGAPCLLLFGYTLAVFFSRGRRLWGFVYSGGLALCYMAGIILM